LAETVVSVGIDEAYAQLKMVLSQSNCVIKAEEAPRSLIAEQGSLWGVSPKSAKKTLRFQLSGAGSQTRISSVASLSSGYVKLTVAGCVFAVVLMVLCVWVSLDLAAFAASLKHSFWSWLAEVGGYVDVRGAILLSDLTRGLAVFLGVTLVLEALVVAYVSSKVNVFAEETLEKLRLG